MRLHGQSKVRAFERLPWEDKPTGWPNHSVATVYLEMLAQCMRHYPALPDVRTIDMDWIRVFYQELIPELKRATTPRKK